MSPSIAESVALLLKCAQCGNHTTGFISHLMTSETVNCTACNTPIRVESGENRTRINELAAACERLDIEFARRIRFS
ncbi:hypothetical protein SAMN05444161_9230 [Rhizobiales bacterium GAS191]|nr:hypothetical protein SAMN05444161_9230 [Rhizobiales bacterium GAS191]